MIDKVQETILRNKLFKKGDKILLAFSYGPDSLALLYLLLYLKKTWKFKIYLGHLNHGLRPSSVTDERRIRKLAAKLKLSLDVKRVKITSSPAGGSREMAGREERYRFLRETAEKRGIRKVALGHHRDDEIETFFINLLRGSGPGGLRGIPLKRKISSANGGIFLVRPLLEVKRDEIRKFLKEQKLRPLYDPTNRQRMYRRNRIRHELIPLLEKHYNPGIREVIRRQMSIFKEEEAFWEKSVLRARREGAVEIKKGEIVFDEKKLKELPPPLRKRVIRFSLKEINPLSPGYSFHHINSVEGFLNRATGKESGLPGGIKVFRDYGKIVLKKDERGPDDFPPLKLKIGGSNYLPLFKGKIGLTVKPFGIREAERKVREMKKNNDRLSAFLDRDALFFPLSARSRAREDRFRPLGMVKETSLKRFLINRKISSRLRDSVPLVVDRKGRIAWVGGVEIAHWARITPRTKRVIFLEVTGARK